MNKDLAALLARVKEATGPDEAIDLAVAQVLGEHVMYFRVVGEEGSGASAMPYSGSLDAALALCERVLPDSDIDLEIRPGMSHGRVHQATDATIYGHVHSPHSGASWRGYGETPAIALLAALLTAKLEETP